MPKIKVTRSILIDRAAAEVYPYLNDFTHWPKWSPWLIMEPDAELSYSEDSKFFSWRGTRVGSGKMEIVREEANKTIHYNLTFLKPWKSKATCDFILQEKDGYTHVKWTMDSSLPFYFFFMKKQMEAFIGMDFDRGLKMLRDYVEKGSIPSMLKHIGDVTLEPLSYIGIKTSTNEEGISTAMEKDFNDIGSYIKDNEIEPSAYPFSIYHKFDPVRKYIVYTAAIPVSDFPNSLPSHFVQGQRGLIKTYTIEHVGPYEHLGNAWSTLMAMIRYKEIKAKKGIDPIETYLNDPANTRPEDLITRIHMPTK